MSFVLELIGRADCIGAGLHAERLALGHGWREREAAEIKLLVVELCCNAVVHGGGGTCELDVDGQLLQLTVEDRGPGLPGWALEGRRLEGGNRSGLGEGLDCARRLSNELVLMNPHGGGARVVAKRFRPARHERSVHG